MARELAPPTARGGRGNENLKKGTRSKKFGRTISTRLVLVTVELWWENVLMLLQSPIPSAPSEVRTRIIQPRIMASWRRDVTTLPVSCLQLEPVAWQQRMLMTGCVTRRLCFFAGRMRQRRMGVGRDELPPFVLSTAFVSAFGRTGIRVSRGKQTSLTRRSVPRLDSERLLQGSSRSPTQVNHHTGEYY